MSDMQKSFQDHLTGTLSEGSYLSEEKLCDLIKRGADPNTCVCETTPVIFFALYKGFEELVKTCLKFGVSPDATDNTGSAIIQEALGLSQAPIVKILIEHKADIHKRCSDGVSLLHSAYFDKDIPCARLLLEAGIPIDVQTTTNRYTPLMLSAYNAQLKMASFLVENGADVFTTNYAGDTAYDISCRYSRISGDMKQAYSRMTEFLKSTMDKKRAEAIEKAVDRAMSLPPEGLKIEYALPRKRKPGITP